MKNQRQIIDEILKLLLELNSFLPSNSSIYRVSNSLFMLLSKYRFSTDIKDSNK
jgi:hypothetical protein